ncbi:thiamine pyrophosphate-dependent enzyme [Pectobacterium parvum]|uniref:thiamine pyrophosphate-dependent enzyme n=1 Tax=Pectobacterium TaxID=122277 RepID=UPI001E554604|nr:MULTISPECIES: thiamine pyrophosphate-dependent enzyme [Pectobacterium]UFK39063.1 thiamine pyrophosphate-dependent enzyme [Pectobacterium parvum]
MVLVGEEMARYPNAPHNLNDQTFSSPRLGYVNMATLYQRLDSWWPADSIGFDDVCLAYKDRQYVTQRPHPHIRFYSLYRGSAMGGAFGAAIGAKLARPEHAVFLFTGDCCFRLFSPVFWGAGRSAGTGYCHFPAKQYEPSHRGAGVA